MTDDNPVQAGRLPGLAAAFLYLKCKELPLHIAGLFTFDSVIPFEKVRREAT